MRATAYVVILALLAGNYVTAIAGSNNEPPSPKNAEEVASARSTMEAELQELRDQLQAQSAQLDAQRAALQEQQRKVEALEEKLKVATSLADSVDSGGRPENARTTFNPTVQLASTSGNTAQTQTAQAVNAQGPMAISFKGITLVPIGFFAAEGVWRQRSLVSDVNTPFNSLPFSNSSAAALNDLNFSARQSRIGMLVQGKLKQATISGYYEADFLSAGTTSNNNQSNSYTFRQRQFWAQAAVPRGWTFTGGQMWSLLTETRHGVDNRTEVPPLTIDSNYNVGFSWARQWGVRVAKNFGDKVWLAASIENPQVTFGGHGFTCPAASAPGVTPLTPASCLFLISAPGTLGGLFNNQQNYSFNRTPDFVVKTVFEPGWGHFEIFGLVINYQDRVFPNAATFSAAGAFNSSRTGGGGGANARVSVLHKHIDLGIHFFGGDGIGRYGSGGLPDATVHPNGTLASIRNYQSLGTLEWHSPKLDVYFNAGGEYDARTFYLTGPTTSVGYGSPLFNNSGCFAEVVPAGSQTTPGVGIGSSGANCTGDTRNLIEGTGGFWFRFFRSERGTLQWGPQYSYVVRHTWSGLQGLSPHVTENMVFTSLRYYIP